MINSTPFYVQLPSNKTFSEGYQEHKNSLPTEIWLAIFTYLHPLDLQAFKLVCKTWNILVSDEKLWKLFDSTLSSSLHLANRCQFSSEFKAMMHACWSKAGNLDKIPGTYDNLVGFLNPQACLVNLRDNLLKISFRSMQTEECFPFKIRQTQIWANETITAISVNGLGAGLRFKNQVHYFSNPREHSFIQRSPTLVVGQKKSLSPEFIYLSKEGFISAEFMLPLQITQPDEELPALLYHLVPDASLLIIGYSNGLVQGFKYLTGLDKNLQGSSLVKNLQPEFKYQDNLRRPVKAICSIGLYIVLHYSHSFQEDQLVILHRQTGQPIFTQEDIKQCVYLSETLFYTDSKGDIFKLNLNSLQTQRVFYAEKERKNKSICKIHLSEKHLISLYTNGRIHAYELSSGLTTVIHETSMYGSSPSTFKEDFKIHGNFLVAHINNQLHIFLLSSLKKIHSVLIDEGFPLKTFLEAMRCRDKKFFFSKDQLVIPQLKKIEFFNPDGSKSQISFSNDPIANYFPFHHVCFIVSEQGKIQQLNQQTLRPVYTCPHLLVKAQLVGNLLICVMEEEECQQLHLVCFKLFLNGEWELFKEWTLPSELLEDQDEISLFDFNHIFSLTQKRPKKKPMISGIELLQHVILIIEKKLIIIDLNTSALITIQDIPHPISSISKKADNFFAVVESKSIQEKVYSFDPTAKVEEMIKILPAPTSIVSTHLFHKRYVLIIFSNGIHTLFDCKILEKRPFPPLPLLHKQQFIEFSKDKLLVFGDIIQEICLQTGEIKEIFKEERLVSQACLDQKVLLIFCSGRIVILDRGTEKFEEVCQVADPKTLGYLYQTEQLVICSYHNDQTDVVNYHLKTGEKLSWKLNTSAIPKNCLLFNKDKSILIGSEIQHDYDDYFIDHFNYILNNKDKDFIDLKLDLKILDILWSEQDLLLFHTEESICLYNMTSQTSNIILSMPYNNIVILNKQTVDSRLKLLIQFHNMVYEDDGPPQVTENWYIFDPVQKTLSCTTSYPLEQENVYDVDDYGQSEFSCTLTFDQKKLIWIGNTCTLWQGEKCLLNQDFSNYLDSKIKFVSHFENKIFIQTYSSKLYFCDFSIDSTEGLKLHFVTNKCKEIEIIYKILVVFTQNSVEFFKLVPENTGPYLQALTQFDDDY